MNKVAGDKKVLRQALAGSIITLSWVVILHCNTGTLLDEVLLHVSVKRMSRSIQNDALKIQ